MRFQLSHPMLVSDSVCGLPRQTLVNEVSCGDRPPFRNLKLFYLHLFCQDLVSNFFARATNIRSTSHHALVTNHTHGEVICGEAVIVATHNLGGHITGRPRSFTCVVWGKNASDSEVSQTQVAFVVKDKVLRLYVAMDYLGVMDCFKGVDKAR